MCIQLDFKPEQKKHQNPATFKTQYNIADPISMHSQGNKCCLNYI